MKKWLSKGISNEKEKILILLLAGILLLVVAIPTEQKTEQEQRLSMKSEQETETDYVSKEELLERKLERILGTVDGIGEVQVMITLKSDGQKRVEKDESISLSGTAGSGEGDTGATQEAREESTVYQRDQNGNEIPYVTETAEPEVAGVLVAAQGAGHAAVAAEIIEAVMALFGTDAHKIKVMKMK